jgi:diaminopimelate decarboxylase
VVAKPFLEKFGIDGPELIIEPGTALVGDCMKFVGTVKSIKQIRGERKATIFGSQKNINMIGVNPPIEIISTGSNQNNYENIDLVGYTCIEGDVLYKNYNGKIGVGDYIIISNCGSYSLVMKPPFILPNFPVIEFSNGMIEIIKKLRHLTMYFILFYFKEYYFGDNI